MSHEAFATAADLMVFRGEEALPDNASILLDRANDLVWFLIRCSYNPSNSEHVRAVKLAACAQVSYWLNTGTSPDDDADVGGFTLGDLSMSGRSSGSDGGKKPNTLCNLAIQYLRSEGLLYRGIVRG